MQDNFIINDYIENDPLSENNLDKTLDLVNEFRLSSKNKTIWLYTGYTFEECRPHTRRAWFAKQYFSDDTKLFNNLVVDDKRAEIVEKINVLVDGRYIGSQRDISLPYRGSSNQRLIDIQQSLQKGEIVLWQI